MFAEICICNAALSPGSGVSSTIPKPVARCPVAPLALDAVGLGAISRQLAQSGMVQAADRFGLDGMLALWQPSPAN